MNAGNSVFMLFIFFIGFFLTYLSWGLQSSINKTTTCKDISLKNSIQGVMVIGLTFIVSSLSYIVCVNTCNSKSNGNMNTTIYLAFTMSLGVVLIVLGSILVNGSKKDSCPISKSSCNAILTFGIVITFSCLIYMGVNYKNKPSAAPTAFSF